MISLLRVTALFSMTLPICAAIGQTSENGDVRLLVIRHAGMPEKNYYELAKQVFIVDPSPTFLPNQDVMTEPGGIRYGVHSIWKVRVRRVTDSQADPMSPKDGSYVLIYERDPDVRFCAVRYQVSKTLSGGRHIEYTDCEDKKQYSFEMTKNWPRPFVICEVEVMDRDALREVWQRQMENPSSGKSCPNGQPH